MCELIEAVEVVISFENVTLIAVAIYAVLRSNEGNTPDGDASGDDMSADDQ